MQCDPYRNISVFFNMDVLLCSLVLIFSIFFIQKWYQKQKKKLPPSPPAVPILGHLHLFKRRPIHTALQQISTKYGPIVYLRLGSRPTILVSSPSIAVECFTKNDVIFANRPPSIVSDHGDYNKTSLSFSPYGNHWRNLRRITTIEVFSSNALNRFSATRAEEIHFIVRKIFSTSNENRRVNLNSLFMELLINVVMKVFTGRQWSDSEPTSKDIFGADIPVHPCDFIPFLRWIGFEGFEKQVKHYSREMDKYLQHLLDESRRNEAGSSFANQSKTIIQSLLSLQEAEPQYYTDDVLKGILADVFAAGPDTTASTMQWAMSLLLNHPEVMERVRNEIDLHVASGRLIEDSDLSKLPYLRCVINETLRLFPTAPILLPHLSSEDCTVGGFNVPRGTILLVDVWAIHKDSKAWEEPTKFKPERFEALKKESEGFKFLPFGMGRRPCPGAGMAMRLVCLTIGTFVHCFEWKRIGPELVDLEVQEGCRFVLSKAKPLEAFCRPRPSMHHLLSQL